jgi:hypothetical protein
MCLSALYLTGVKYFSPTVIRMANPFQLSTAAIYQQLQQPLARQTLPIHHRPQPEAGTLSALGGTATMTPMLRQNLTLCPGTDWDKHASAAHLDRSLAAGYPRRQRMSYTLVALLTALPVIAMGVLALAGGWVDRMLVKTAALR